MRRLYWLVATILIFMLLAGLLEFIVAASLFL